MTLFRRDSSDAHSAARLPPFIVRLAFELLIVFVGVYAAFALAEHEVQRDKDVRREQLKAALIREIRDITRNTRQVADFLPTAVQRFDSSVAAGAKPPLEPWIDPIRFQPHMWNAAIESGAFDLFDVATVYELSRFYNELNAGFEQIEQLRYLSESVLIPNLGSGTSEFYEASGPVRAKYQWYPDGLSRLSYLAGSITELGDSIAAALEAEQTAR